MASLDVASLSLEPVVPKGGGVIKCWRTEAAEVKERWPGEVKITQASGAWLGLLYSTHIFKGAGLWEPGRARGWCISLVALSSSAFSSNHRISPFRAFRPSKAPSHFPYRWPSSAPSRAPPPPASGRSGSSRWAEGSRVAAPILRTPEAPVFRFSG